MKRIFYILFMLVVATNLFAQKFETTADRTTVGVGERFQVYFTFEGQSNDISGFKPPSFEGLRVLSGPNQSTSMQIINGQVSSSVTFSFILTPVKEGEYTIGEAEVSYKGTKYRSNPLKINVVKGQTSQQQQQNETISEEELSNNVFIVASADKRNVYQGEQVTVTYKLYTKLNISSPQISKLPTYNGFWQEEISTSNTINWEIEMYNGERYRSATIKKVALFPTKSGELTVTPFELDIPVLVKRRRTSNDFFDDFFNDSFFGRTETIQFKAKSNSIKISAEPLPQRNVPASFNGAVGDFDIKTEIDRTTVKANESISLRFTVTGTGNIQLLDLPKLELPAGFEVYEPKSNLSVNRSGKISGTKTFDYLIVPRVPGAKIIKPIEFSFFSPTKNRYITQTSSEYRVEVAKGDGSVVSSSGFSKEDIKLLNEDIRFIKTSDFNLRTRNGSRLIPIWFWLGLIIPALVLGSVIALQRRQQKLSSNTQLLKYKKAEKVARSRLKHAKNLMAADKSLEFYSEISRAMNGYLEDKLNIQKSEFTLGKAVDFLTQKDVNEKLKEQVKNIYEKCEFARFAPSAQTPSAEQSLYDDTINTIVGLEQSLNTKKKK
ncbi:MAG: BatD family protein [Melioribacteraceae bacterium]|nr:BatD family protein [Melioribacteraceae bacterium]